MIVLVVVVPLISVQVAGHLEEPGQARIGVLLGTHLRLRIIDMDRRSFLALGGAYMLSWSIPALSGGGTEVFRMEPLNEFDILAKIEYKAAPRAAALLLNPLGGLRRSQEIGWWVTPIFDVRLRPGHETPWFHKEGPFGLYQTTYNEARRDENRETLERMVRVLVNNYDRRVFV